MKSHLLLIASIVCAALLVRVAEAVDKRPNVLFLIADDLNNSLGCYGDPRAKTPNLDRLAARGTRFEHAYCSYPLCGPSRNSLLTGLYPNSTGILANGQVFRQTIPQQPSMPQAFRNAGYFAARVGKLFHYDVPGSIGTDGHDDLASWELQANPAGVDRLDDQAKIFSLIPGKYGAVLSWYASPHVDELHTDAKTAADAEWILERCAKQPDRPFFLAVGFFRPHLPYVAPQRYFDLYPEHEMPVVTGIQEDQADIPRAGLASHKPEEDNLTDDLRRQCLQGYYASISFMDAQVGRVVAVLDRLGLADNTIIVFTSDHGYHLGEHGLWQKLSLFEQSARIPLLIVAPGSGQAGNVVAAPVSHIDLFPTLADLSSVKPPDNLQGQSVAPALKDASFVGRGWAVTQVVRGANVRQAKGTDAANNRGGRFFGYSLRTPRWRYTEWDEGHEGRELYDHDADPQEIINLAALPEHAATISELSQQLRKGVQGTFPSSGKTPTLRSEIWSPGFTRP